MSQNNSSSVDVENLYAPFISYKIQFWTYLIMLIPSMLCSIFALYHLLFDRTLRNSLNNHIIIIFLILDFLCELTVFPWALHYFHVEGVWERSFVFCSIWAFLDWTFYMIQTFVLAWGAIERHILIFHHGYVATRKKRFFFHYLPPFILISYCIIFYISINFLSPCENYYSNDYMLCVAFCIYDNVEYFKWDTVAHQLVPALIIIIFSIGLLVRVIAHKIRIHQPVQWRKYQKMTVQLLSIVLIYCIFYLPYACFMILLFCGYELDQNVSSTLGYTTYMLPLLLPFCCMLTLPELGKRMRKFQCFARRPRRIASINTM